ncbi:hypothetical protein COCNU_11G010590 [Cocos nucifera]|uniref:Uncharacterized protein n=1 Tax=Cocos nucifera TaxID=13894 RepID=A0A8K0IPJ6_COCNU|nr:hypothetical protein COCNU_11G010590 [Cocos nucifera]
MSCCWKNPSSFVPIRDSKSTTLMAATGQNLLFLGLQFKAQDKSEQHSGTG